MWMEETKKGHMKLTVEVEINEALMEAMKEAMSKMHWKMPDMMKREEK